MGGSWAGLPRLRCGRLAPKFGVCGHSERPQERGEATDNGDGARRQRPERGATRLGGPTKFSYRWLRCETAGGEVDATTPCTAISHGRDSVYRVRPANLGQQLRILVTAANSSGATPAASDPSPLIESAGERPVSTTPPAIVGESVVGSTLTAKSGAINTPETVTLNYLWLTCGKTGGGCSEIAASGSKTYSLRAQDVGCTRGAPA